MLRVEAVIHFEDPRRLAGGSGTQGVAAKHLRCREEGLGDDVSLLAHALETVAEGRVDEGLEVDGGVALLAHAKRRLQIVAKLLRVDDSVPVSVHIVEDGVEVVDGVLEGGDLAEEVAELKLVDDAVLVQVNVVKGLVDRVAHQPVLLLAVAQDTLAVPLAVLGIGDGREDAAEPVGRRVERVRDGGHVLDRSHVGGTCGEKVEEGVLLGALGPRWGVHGLAQPLEVGVTEQAPVDSGHGPCRLLLLVHRRHPGYREDLAARANHG
mmetsp:Transcript_16121/g.40632  ORF Transcript_16121/g.40632 Transcript_16121/m.40632 type:complete len:266 (-) Transcript_16121:270-1067(-)